MYDFEIKLVEIVGLEWQEAAHQYVQNHAQTPEVDLLAVVELCQKELSDRRY